MIALYEDTGLPVKDIIQCDDADTAWLEGEGSFADVIFHKTAHVRVFDLCFVRCLARCGHDTMTRLWALVCSRLAHYTSLMVCRLVTPFARLLVVTVLAFAMAVSGFAHRTQSTEPNESMLIYIATGGSLADLCGERGLDEFGGSQTCDACRLVDTATVSPVLAGRRDATGLQIAVVLTVKPSFVISGADDPSRPVRAPPNA